MTEAIPAHHPLRRLFSDATTWAFREVRFEAPEARDRLVGSYLADEVLLRFIRADNLYRIRSARGRPLAEVAEMMIQGMGGRGTAALEVQRHIGDYTLFICGLFPESLRRLRQRGAGPDSLLMQVGRLFVSFADPADYYQQEGRQAYHKAAEIGRELALAPADLFEKLSLFYRSYVNVLSLIRAYLDASSIFAEAKRIIL